MKPRLASPPRPALPVKTARLVVELGEENANNGMSNAVTVDLSGLFSGQSLEHLIRTLQGLQSPAPNIPERRPPSPPPVKPVPRKVSIAELVPIDSAASPSYRLKPENVVGRSKKCDFTLPSAKVSRRHFKVSAAAGGFVVEDLGSANHTWVNDLMVEQPTPLANGDVIGAGDLRFEFRLKSS